MQRDEAGSNSIVNDTNILHTALVSLGYSDSVDRQAENHFMHSFPLPLTNIGETMVNGSNEFWKSTQDQFMEGTPLPVTFQYPLEYQKSANIIVDSPFENANHGYEGTLPLTGASNREGDFNNFLPPQELLGRVTTNYTQSEWVMMGEQERSPQFSSQLSLSLATSQPPPTLHGTSAQERCSEMSSSAITSYSQQRRQSEHAYSSGSNLSSSFDSKKPFQLSSLLSGSRFFHAMQEILAEIASYGLDNFDGMMCYDSSVGISDGVELSIRGQLEIDEREVEARKKNLFTLLQVVDERYSQCMDEIHTVVSAFHAVTELDPNLHARFALPTISFMYKNLRERISNHILSMGETRLSSSKGGESTRDHQENSLETGFLQNQWALPLQQLRKRDHQLWRPQRGLPERSVSVLRTWMFQNFLHPYPKDAEKHLLALKSGLTRSQVSNWFINARVRLWKPMIEEMYTEMNRRKARSRNDEDVGSIQRNCMRFENGRFTMG